MTNREIAKVFADMAIYLSMDGETFRARAHERVAETIESKLQDSVEELYNSGGVESLQSNIPGVGKGLAQDIQELLKTGHLKEYKAYQKKFPVHLDELLRIEGLGPKSIASLYHHLNIRTVKDLQKAATQGKIQDLPGFGKKTEQHILHSIQFVTQETGRLLLGEVLPLARHIRDRLCSLPGVKTIEIAGSLRRMKETIGDIDLVGVARDPQSVMDYFVSMPEVKSIEEHGSTRSIVRLSNGIDCDLRLVPVASIGATLLYFTGNKEHCIALRTLAQHNHMTLNEYGLYKGEGENKILLASKTENEIYNTLGLSYIDPELREMKGEIERATQGDFPPLISYKSLKGDFQVQSDWTDGAHSIEQMAHAAQRAGLSYLAITDHTQSLTVAGGLDEKRLQSQARYIDRLNEKMKGITILKGAEVNILKDGSLDISDIALHKLDVVGISVHSHFSLSKEEQTARVIRAMQHPSVNILFHPTGRRIHRREALQLDMNAIIKAAKQYDVILEINSQPERLDLNDVHIRQARDYGVYFCIDSDAHSSDDFSYLEYGIGQARRAGIQESEIINTLSLKEVKKILKRKH